MVEAVREAAGPAGVEAEVATAEGGGGEGGGGAGGGEGGGGEGGGGSGGGAGGGEGGGGEGGGGEGGGMEGGSWTTTTVTCGWYPKLASVSGEPNVHVGGSARHSAYTPLWVPSTPPGRSTVVASCASSAPPCTAGAAAAAPVQSPLVIGMKRTTSPTTSA